MLRHLQPCVRLAIEGDDYADAQIADVDPAVLPATSLYHIEFIRETDTDNMVITQNYHAYRSCSLSAVVTPKHRITSASTKRYDFIKFASIIGHTRICRHPTKLLVIQDHSDSSALHWTRLPAAISRTTIHDTTADTVLNLRTLSHNILARRKCQE